MLSANPNPEAEHSSGALSNRPLISGAPTVQFVLRANPEHLRGLPHYERQLSEVADFASPIMFPSYFGLEEIKRAVRTNLIKGELDGRCLCVDGTVHKAIELGAILPEELRARKIEVLPNTIDIYCGLGPIAALQRLHDIHKDRLANLQIQLEPQQVSMQATSRSFIDVTRRVLDREVPQAVFVFTSNLIDHPPFQQYYRALVQKNLRNTPEEHIARWLIKASIPNKRIHICSEDTQGDRTEEIKDRCRHGQTVWVLYDSHLRSQTSDPQISAFFEHVMPTCSEQQKLQKPKGGGIFPRDLPVEIWRYVSHLSEYKLLDLQSLSSDELHGAAARIIREDVNFWRARYSFSHDRPSR